MTEQEKSQILGLRDEIMYQNRKVQELITEYNKQIERHGLKDATLEFVPKAEVANGKSEQRTA